MLRFRILSIIIILLTTVACENLWDKHFQVNETTVDMLMWDQIRTVEQYSSFVSYVEELDLDTLFGQGSSFTLFIPTNDAFESFNPDTGDLGILLGYHVLNYIFSVYSVTHAQLLQTTVGKFAQAEFYEGNYHFSGSKVSYASPLYLDGRYYELEEIAYPLPNLYEYISLTTQVMKDYIDNFDSILLDLENSKPLGFNPDGQVIYDSVYSIVNYFDSIYFPVKDENRHNSATFLLFNDEDYYTALDKMAADLGNGMTGPEIPVIWQEEVFIPELLKTGLFPNTLQYEDFMQGRLKNVQGDSVDVDYFNINPDSKVLCSNGAAYQYYDFKVPEYLYKGEIRLEGEHMVDSLGGGIYYWKPGYKVSGSAEAVSANPIKSFNEGASNDSIMKLTFPSSPFQGEFKLEFYFRNTLAQKYLFVWAANYRPSGIYKVYANDVLIREYDMFDLRSVVYGVDGLTYYLPDANGNNKLDAWIDNLTEYGDLKITIEYVESGGLSSTVNGLNIDFVSLIPSE